MYVCLYVCMYEAEEVAGLLFVLGLGPSRFFSINIMLLLIMIMSMSMIIMIMLMLMTIKHIIIIIIINISIQIILIIIILIIILIISNTFILIIFGSKVVGPSPTWSCLFPADQTSAHLGATCIHNACTYNAITWHICVYNTTSVVHGVHLLDPEVRQIDPSKAKVSK